MSIPLTNYELTYARIIGWITASLPFSFFALIAVLKNASIFTN